MARPGRCQPTALEKLKLVPTLVIGKPPNTVLRVVKWASTWARHNLVESHWHLGPVAVDPGCQGQGIGTAMLCVFCSKMDDLRIVSYLETDKAENVRFYERFDFRVVSEANVLGVPNLVHVEASGRRAVDAALKPRRRRHAGLRWRSQHPRGPGRTYNVWSFPVLLHT